jgi:hypothetical protein
VLRPLDCLDEENYVVAFLRVIDDADTGLCMSVFAANREREVHPLVCILFI